MTAALGLFLLYGIPAGTLLIVAVLIRRLVRQFEARDVMESFRPARADVAATDRALDDIHYDIVVEGNNYD